jgi:hypothetical protein
MWGVIHKNLNNTKVHNIVNVFPIYAAVDGFDCHILSFLFNDASDVISGVESAGLAIVEAKHSAHRSMLQNILFPQPMLENILLYIIRNLAEFHLTLCCSILYLFLQHAEICIGQCVQHIASCALGNTVAKSAKHSLHINMGLTDEKPQSKQQSEVAASILVATRNEGTNGADFDLKKKNIKKEIDCGK